MRSFFSSFFFRCHCSFLAHACRCSRVPLFCYALSILGRADIALIGLAVMGQNFILNMNDHGFVVSFAGRCLPSPLLPCGLSQGPCFEWAIFLYLGQPQPLTCLAFVSLVHGPSRYAGHCLQPHRGQGRPLHGKRGQGCVALLCRPLCLVLCVCVCLCVCMRVCVCVFPSLPNSRTVQARTSLVLVLWRRWSSHSSARAASCCLSRLGLSLMPSSSKLCACPTLLPFPSLLSCFSFVTLF